MAAGLVDIASQLERVGHDIAKVEEELARVGHKITPLEEKEETKSLDGDDRVRLDALRKEKEQLRKEKEQLREKENLLLQANPAVLKKAKTDESGKHLFWCYLLLNLTILCPT
jgi:archaellum component FlaC